MSIASSIHQHHRSSSSSHYGRCRSAMIRMVMQPSTCRQQQQQQQRILYLLMWPAALPAAAQHRHFHSQQQLLLAVKQDAPWQQHRPRLRPRRWLCANSGSILGGVPRVLTAPTCMHSCLLQELLPAAGGGCNRGARRLQQQAGQLAVLVCDKTGSPRRSSEWCIYAWEEALHQGLQQLHGVRGGSSSALEA
jgi:hypothetical protein